MQPDTPGLAPVSHVGLLRFGRNRVGYPRDGARVFRVAEKGAVHRPYGRGVF